MQQSIDSSLAVLYALRVIQRFLPATARLAVLLGAVLSGFGFAAHAQSASGETQAPAIAPAASELNRLEANPDDHPLFVMTLLRFKDGSGPAACHEYLNRTVPLLRDLDGELIFYGEVVRFQIDFQGAHQVFGFRPNPWDALIVERYPSRKVLCTLTADKSHQSAAERLRGTLKDTFVYAFNGTGYKNIRRSSAEGWGPPDFPAGDTLYMLNLLHFKYEGGYEDFVENYGKKAMPLIRKRGGDLLFGLEAEQLLIGEEEYHRFILVRYPSREVFTEMMLNKEYHAISHYREETIDIGHLYGFNNAAGELEISREGE